MQETQIWSLGQEDPTCARATTTEAHAESVLWKKGSPRLEKPTHSNEA